MCSAKIKIHLLVLLFLLCSPAYAENIKFPKIDVRHKPADYSFKQAQLTPDNFKYDEKNRQTFQMDFRNCDLNGFASLLKKNKDIFYAGFNTKTEFPDKLPRGFEPGKIMELGKNPGLGIRELHKQGITGKGIGIGIIDQGLLVDHVEYADRLKLYEEIHLVFNEASMHASAVASIAVGKTTGVAPEADLYFIGETNGENVDGKFVYDLNPIAKSINRLIEVNKQLPKENKIRVISISLGLDSITPGYDETVESIKEADKSGIFVIVVADEHFKIDGMGRFPLADPDNRNSYASGTMFCRNKLGSQPDELEIPMDSRTVADPNGNKDYYFSRVGGISWTIPWVAGLYALACQVSPDITPEIFWAAALKTAEPVKFSAHFPAPSKFDGEFTLKKVVNPAGLIKAIKGMNRQIGAHEGGL
ncbi:MAG: S8/S53 family peptidase [Elusimicrobiales bacterium]